MLLNMINMQIRIVAQQIEMYTKASRLQSEHEKDTPNYVCKRQ